MSKKLFLGSCILWISVWKMIICTVDLSFGGAGIIYPGKGVDDIQIGVPLPKNLSPLIERKNIVTTGADGPVKQIKVSSPAFTLAVSLLRIKQSKMADVLRFYGKGETDLRSDKIIVRYPSQGIDFEIDRVNERIEAVTIYRPVLPKFSVEQYRERLQRK